MTLFPESHCTHAAFVYSLHPTRLCGPEQAVPYQTLKNEQRKDGGHLQAVQMTGAVMPSWSSAARCSHAPPQLKAMGGAAHSACCCMQGRKGLDRNRVTVESRLVGNLPTNLLVSIRNIAKMLHRGDKSQLHGETFHKEHGKGHFTCPLSL